MGVNYFLFSLQEIPSDQIGWFSSIFHTFSSGLLNAAPLKYSQCLPKKWSLFHPNCAQGLVGTLGFCLVSFSGKEMI